MEIDDSQALFAQLGAEPGEQAVKTLIENHDAWSHSQAVAGEAVWARVGVMQLDATRRARLAEQRRRLEPLVTRLPSRYASAS